MRAFLSHSSKDKAIVQKVFDALGAANSVYDRETFEEGKRSAEEILRGLSMADVFVLFLSRHSVASEYVKSEIAVAMERVFAGRMRGVLIFSLDDTSHQDLPETLRHYSVERNAKPAQIARRIRSRMIELQLQQGNLPDIFVGRQSELRDLEHALTLPPAEMRPVISVAGWQGIGRRTFVLRGIRTVFPYLKREQPAIVVSDNDALEDVFRKVFDVADGAAKTSGHWTSAIQTFRDHLHPQRMTALAELVESMNRAKELLVIVGDGGLLRENGDYQPYVGDLISRLPRGPRPSLVLIHRRRLPPSKQALYPQVHFTSLASLDEEDTASLLSAHLKQRELPFTRHDLDELVQFVGGHPENIRIAAEYARQYGLEQLERERAEFTDVLVFRALEVLKKIEVSSVAQDICAALLDFQYLQIDDFVTSIDATDADIMSQLRFLEDQGILERVGKYYRISPYLVDAIARWEAPATIQKTRKAIGQRMLAALSEVSSLDDVSLSLINAALLTGIRSGKLQGPGLLAQFLLPSHLLTIAREEYDAGSYRQAVMRCREALRSRERLTLEAQIECYRLLSISLLRLGLKDDFQGALRDLERYRGRTAKRNVYFLRGFEARLDGRQDDAERDYRIAFGIDRRNFHVLRELAGVLLQQGRFDEAEAFARTAYSVAPTNPFIIDILCHVLIGKCRRDELEGNVEVAKLLNELKALGTDESRSFYDERMAQLLHRTGDQDAAWRHANAAVERSPRHFGPRVARLSLARSLGHIKTMEEDIAFLDGLSGRTEGKANRFILDRAKIGLAILKGDLGAARSYLDRAHNLPRHVRAELTAELSRLRPEKARAGGLKAANPRRRGSVAVPSNRSQR